MAEAGNVKTSSKLIMQQQLAALDEELGNNLLCILAVKNKLKGFFQEVQMSRTACDWLQNCFKMDNKKGSTFLAVAVNNEQMIEDDIIQVIELMVIISGSESVSGLCKKKDNRGNSLLHVAVKKSLMKLMSKILSITPDSHKIKNKDGYNPLHLAVQQKNRPMVKCILQQKDFDINVRVGNGETPLHIAAQLFQTDILTDLIGRGGDLSLKDEEDGHTPLHDCLQQVYFKGEHNETKFIEVWNTILEEAVTWWCWKMTPVVQANESEEQLKWKAVYYLRSCIRNDKGLSVLQYAADRGLVMCVQAMLTAKNTFEVQDENENATQNFEIDVTNLCPEYLVMKETLYSKTELNALNPAMSQTKQNQEQRKNGQDNSAANDGISSLRSNDHKRTKILSGETSVLDKDTNNISQSKPSRSQEDKESDSEIMSFLESLNKVSPSNKAGEILESIPMKKLCELEWRVSRWFFIGWIVVHVTLMALVTNAISSSENISAVWTWDTIVLFVLIVPYALVITVIHVLIRFSRWQILQKLMKFAETKMKIQEPERLVKYNEANQSFNLLKMLKNSPRLSLDLKKMFRRDPGTIIGYIFTVCTLTAIQIQTVTTFSGFLVSGWLLLLVPLTIVTRIYKLLSVLEDIVINIVIPWSTIYFVVSIGFASAIQLEFKQ